ncbi:DUF4189 domain-containing protein [Nocardia huaxiensis]|uniref:DUF4189 domain-containing protein n=1 Tax=Nocardia huaxiensis TaxID=2755382 RepID=UPI001E2D33A3|nr:DUF4189 domain-containing protein [Nocardia huaxiensis]UFS96455.1 DUF4189 domain-containing protein [Nocardia huaxiensis]
MSLLGKCALAMVVPATGAMLAAGAGSAHAAGDLYGAIAISAERSPNGTLGDFPSRHTGVGVAVDYPTQAAADEAARSTCRGERCYVVAQVHNGCASVAEFDTWTAWSNGVEPVYVTEKGSTAAAAEQAAIDKGNWLMSAPTNTAMFALGIARVVKPVFILDTICTSNAG